MHDIRMEFLVLVSRTSFLDEELGSSVMGLKRVHFVSKLCIKKVLQHSKIKYHVVKSVSLSC